MKIRFEAVSFAYPSGVKALEAVNLQIESGLCVALIGENGAGKSTLVKHLNGLLRPESGAVWVGDWNAAEHSTAELAVRVGFLFQNPDDQLFERSVFREVAFGPRTVAQIKTHWQMSVADAAEFDLMAAMVTGADLQKFRKIFEFEQVCMLGQARVPSYDTPALVRARLGLPTPP